MPLPFLAAPRPLTPGETALLRPLFGAGLDYDRMRIHARRYLPFQPPTAAMAPNGHVYFSAASASADFSREPPARRAWFVHEAVHVWQQQNRVFRDLRLLGALAMVRGDYLRAGPLSGRPGRYLYDYALAPGLDLTAYGFEQQATIIEDYFALLQSDPAHPRRAAFDHATHGVLAAFLRDATYARGRRSRRIRLARFPAVHIPAGPAV